jgi:hypothetical protein
MRLKVKQSRPRNAIKLSVELEAFNKAEESNRTSRGYLRSADSNNRDDENKLNLSANSIAIEKLEKGMNSMQDMIKQLTEEIGKFKQNSRSTYTPESKERNCYNCESDYSISAHIGYNGFYLKRIFIYLKYELSFPFYR